MHRSMVKLFLVSGLFFGMHAAPLAAMSQQSFSNVVELKDSYRELYKRLLPWGGIPVVSKGICCLGNLTVWLQEDPVIVFSNRAFVRDLSIVRECLNVISQKCPEARVNQLVTRVLELLDPLSFAMIPARAPTPDAPQAAVELPVNPTWSLFNNTFHIDVSSIRKDLSPISFASSNQSSNASTPLETPRIDAYDIDYPVLESGPTTPLVENNINSLARASLKNTERRRDVSARDRQKMLEDRYPGYYNGDAQ